MSNLDSQNFKIVGDSEINLCMGEISEISGVKQIHILLFRNIYYSSEQ